eukprot:UN14583
MIDLFPILYNFLKTLSIIYIYKIWPKQHNVWSFFKRFLYL